MVSTKYEEHNLIPIIVNEWNILKSKVFNLVSL